MLVWLAYVIMDISRRLRLKERVNMTRFFFIANPESEYHTLT